MPAVLKHLPRANRMYANVYQSQRDRGLSEERSHASAWAAVQRAGYYKGADGRWHAPGNPHAAGGVSDVELGLGVLGGAIIVGGFVGYVLRRLIRGRKELRGKGAFMRSLVGPGSPAELVETLEELDLSWVLLAGEEESGQVSTIYRDRLPAYVEALDDAGITAWLWGWPMTPGREADRMIELAGELGVGGVVYDLEGQVYARKYAEPIADMLRKTREAGLAVGVTTYPIRSFHPGFPWSAFERVGLDVGMPQAYDSKHKWGPDFQRSAVEDWSAFSRQVVPIIGAGPDQTAADMARESAPVVGMRAVGFWTLDHILRSPAKRAFVRNLEIERRAVA